MSVNFLASFSLSRPKIPVNHIDVGHFQTLRQLELVKINVASVVQLNLLCTQLEVLRVNYSVSSFSEVLIDPLQHEADPLTSSSTDQLNTSQNEVQYSTPENAWKALRELDCGHNTIPRLDSSLR